MIKTMLVTIEKHNMFVKGDKVIVGLSGGPDSLALTHALFHISDSVGFELVPVHVNHLLRGEFADADEQFVMDFCSNLGLECHTFRVNVSEYASELGISFEEAGRRVRYEKFEEVRAKVGGTKIAIGQNRNDLVETFFINLFRGSGIDGLSSIEYVRDSVFVRPLLEVDRTQIEDYCDQNNLVARRDHTNDENDYVRNKIRNVLIPYIKDNFNPSINDTVFKTTEMMKDERMFWNSHVEKLFDEMCVSEKGKVLIRGSSFVDLTVSEQRQLMRYCIRKVRKHLVDISLDQLNQILKLTRTNTSIRLDEQYVVSYEYGNYVVSKIEPLTKNVKAPEIYSFDLDLESYSKFDTNEWVVALDADHVKGKLTIRTRKSGDRFIPLGMKGHKKIKDFFIDEKVPVAKRDAIWLICDDEKIVWIHGMRIHDHCKITKDTKNIMIISLQDIVEKR
ncbi:MAG: tRNA lysidine(34) synthetase TilS [Bacillota bacterium]|nr:tRNA lysidine(34) synthetase TilS [Bacillota bacterium]